MVFRTSIVSLIAAILLLAAACTYQVGDPQITIACVEVDLPGLATKYCKDAGTQQIPPKDSSADTGKQ